MNNLLLYNNSGSNMNMCWLRYMGLLLLLICSGLNASEYQFRHYDTNNGLSQNSVMSIIQDSMGFMWFGTNDGMNRFDGRSFKVYHKGSGANQLGSDRIGVMYEAPNTSCGWVRIMASISIRQRPIPFAGLPQRLLLARALSVRST